MEYSIELRFEDKNYNAVIHFFSTFTANDDNEAELFCTEIKAGLLRQGVQVFQLTNLRIGDNPILKERMYEYHNFFLTRATASIKIDQFYVENPDQKKSLYENLTEKLFSGEDSTANIGRKFDIPVRVLDKDTRNPIAGEFYYFFIEHLIPKT